jgi:hypothetical protein
MAGDGPCAAGQRISDFNNRDKIFSLIGAPVDLPSLPGAAPGIKAQAGLLRSWREGETFVGLLDVRDRQCWPTALFRLDIARRAPLVERTEGEVMPDVHDLRVTPDLSLVIERNPPGRPSWGDRLFRVGWLVACRVKSLADSSCSGDLAWVADPVEVGWFAQRSFSPADSATADFDALLEDPASDVPGRAQPMSLVIHERPSLLWGPAAAEAARLGFEDPRAVRQRADDPLVLRDSAGCAVGRLRPDLVLTGWSELQRQGRAVVAYIASAKEPNQGDFELFNHWLRVVEVDRSRDCEAGHDSNDAEFPIVEVGPFSAPPVSGLAFGQPSGPLDQQLVIRHASPVDTYAAIPWSREALQWTMCAVLAASRERGTPPDERYSSTTYRLLKGPAGSVFRELEAGRGACSSHPSPNTRPDGSLAAEALASGSGPHDSTTKP